MTRIALAAAALVALAVVLRRRWSVPLVWDATVDDVDWLSEYQPHPLYAGRN